MRNAEARGMRGMHVLVLGLGLVFLVSHAQAQRVPDLTKPRDPRLPAQPASVDKRPVPPDQHPAGRLALELAGGLLGTAVAIAGATAVFSASMPDERSCVDDEFCDEGGYGDALGSVIVTGLAYFIFAPISVGSGVAGAGAIKGRGIHFEFAIGGAVLGMAAAVGIALAASEAGAGDDAALGLLVGVGLIAPVLTSMLFYELSPKPDNAKRVAASWQPYVSATADGRGGALGVVGVF